MTLARTREGSARIKWFLLGRGSARARAAWYAVQAAARRLLFLEMQDGSWQSPSGQLEPSMPACNGEVCRFLDIIRTS